MRIAIYSSHAYERPFLEEANREHGHELLHLDARLDATTAALAVDCQVAAIFANDDASAPSLRALKAAGVQCLALRSAGFNHVDLEEAARLGIPVARVPAYSPHAVAEHAVALMLSLNRKIHRAYGRVREQNFSLDGLMGFDMFGKTTGIVGTGKIGAAAAKILHGFGCTLLFSDPVRNPECEPLGEYVPLEELLARSDIVTLHCPLTPATHHLIGEAALAAMRHGAMLINTSRGGVIDTKALIRAIKRGHLGAVGLDVYEEEGDLFFKDLSERPILDDVFARLVTFPNVLVTAHQGFMTREAISAIARTTIENATGFAHGEIPEANLVSLRLVVG
jgi:D-lactate dehydrogenase